MKKLLMLGLFLGTYLNASAQEDPKESEFYDWFNQSPESGIAGVATDKAYELVKGKKSRTVLVAVIDDGVAIDHEDLQGKIWTNSKEIDGNGVDDDGNGFIDDVHGWNFLGNDKGENVVHDNYEAARIYKEYKDRYSGKAAESINPNEKVLFETYKRAELFLNQKMNEMNAQKGNVMQYVNLLQQGESLIKTSLGVDKYTDDLLDQYTPTNQTESQIVEFMKKARENGINLESAKDYLDYLNSSLDYHLNPDFNSRDTVNVSNEHYGNPLVNKVDPDHGTHVAGIIAANRNNDIGIRGIADNVLIMPVRTVPDGDERDMDVANAIRYAVNNGAEVINMSFGKAFSPKKQLVDEAIRYADSKGVILVHAAGNEGENLDITYNFPTPYFGPEGDQGKAKLFITVGANGKDQNEELPAPFSNFGKEKVDLFAPGYHIMSLQPHNKYKDNSGTSMAAPVVTGCVAFMKSYFPNLKPQQIIDILMKSVEVYDIEVNVPQDESGLVQNKESDNFKNLSVSGGVVNLAKAVELAMKTK